KQEAVGDAAIGLHRVKIVRVTNGKGLDHGQAIAGLDLGHALWGFASVQLKDVRLHPAYDGIEGGIVGIHRDGNDLSFPICSAPELAGKLNRQVARALLKEDKAEMAGATLKGSSDSFLGFQATDFNVQRHGR